MDETKQLIDGPGRYPRRDGGVALITGKDRESGYDWRGFKEESPVDGVFGWFSNGRFLLFRESGRDVVGPRLPEEALQTEADRLRKKNDELRTAIREIIDDASPCLSACHVTVAERLIDRAKELIEAKGVSS